MNPVALTIDLGGTDIKAGLVDASGAIHDDFRVPTGDDLGAETVAARIMEVIGSLNSKAALRGLFPQGIGIGVPGGVYEDRATISQAPNFPAWRDVPMKSLIEKQTGMPVLLDNDANLAALGESWMGAGLDVDSMILFTLGTGVGGGVILDGEIWRGAWGMAGEIGHVTVDPGGPQCGCGNHGCLEALAGKKALIEAAISVVAENRSPILQNLIEGDAALMNPKHIYDAAKAGCEACRQIFAAMGENIGIVCASLLNVLCVEKFVLGGGISGAFEFIIDSVNREILKRAYRIPASRVRVEKAVLGNRAGLLGAGKMILDYMPAINNGRGGQ